MPTNRRRQTRGRDHRINRRAVEAFVAGDVAELDRALGRIPLSDPSPIEATTETCPMEMTRTYWPVQWPEARRLRAALQKEAERLGYADNT